MKQAAGPMFQVRSPIREGGSPVRGRPRGGPPLRIGGENDLARSSCSGRAGERTAFDDLDVVIGKARAAQPRATPKTVIEAASRSERTRKGDDRGEDDQSAMVGVPALVW